MLAESLEPSVIVMSEAAVEYFHSFQHFSELQLTFASGLRYCTVLILRKVVICPNRCLVLKRICDHRCCSSTPILAVNCSISGMFFFGVMPWRISSRPL